MKQEIVELFVRLVLPSYPKRDLRKKNTVTLEESATGIFAELDTLPLSNKF